jgi:transketolase
MIITNSALKLMRNWTNNKVVESYSMSPDFDNKWRTGGSLEEIITESKLDEKSVMKGIKNHANERSSRLELIKKHLPLSGV